MQRIFIVLYFSSITSSWKFLLTKTRFLVILEMSFMYFQMYQSLQDKLKVYIGKLRQISNQVGQDMQQSMFAT